MRTFKVRYEEEDKERYYLLACLLAPVAAVGGGGRGLVVVAKSATTAAAVVVAGIAVVMSDTGTELVVLIGWRFSAANTLTGRTFKNLAPHLVRPANRHTLKTSPTATKILV